MRKEIEEIIDSICGYERLGQEAIGQKYEDELTDQICSFIVAREKKQQRWFVKALEDTRNDFIERLEGLGRTEMSGWEYIDTIIKELKGE